MRLAYAGGYPNEIQTAIVKHVQEDKLGFWDVVQNLITVHGANVVIVFLLCATAVLCFFIWARYVKEKK